MLRKKKNSTGERKVEKRKKENSYIYNGNTWRLGGRQ